MSAKLDQESPFSDQEQTMANLRRRWHSLSNRDIFKLQLQLLPPCLPTPQNEQRPDFERDVPTVKYLSHLKDPLH